LDRGSKEDSWKFVLFHEHRAFACNLTVYNAAAKECTKYNDNQQLKPAYNQLYRRRAASYVLYNIMLCSVMTNHACLDLTYWVCRALWNFDINNRCGEIQWYLTKKKESRKATGGTDPHSPTN